MICWKTISKPYSAGSKRAQDTVKSVSKDLAVDNLPSSTRSKKRGATAPSGKAVAKISKEKDRAVITPPTSVAGDLLVSTEGEKSRMSHTQAIARLTQVTQIML